MPHIPPPVEVILEVGKARVFASARAWPGWCRSGTDEATALKALLACAPQYLDALKTTRLQFAIPKDVQDLIAVERLTGDATTDFGAPSQIWPDDKQPIAPSELARFQKILQACWAAFDAAVQSAVGKSLRTGPRGGGRDLTKISEHVCEVDEVYLKSLGGKPALKSNAPLTQRQTQVREDILLTLSAAIRGEVPERGPRGGLRWTPRYFVRRLAWHELDHAWEIARRIE